MQLNVTDLGDWAAHPTTLQSVDSELVAAAAVERPGSGGSINTAETMISANERVIGGYETRQPLGNVYQQSVAAIRSRRFAHRPTHTLVSLGGMRANANTCSESNLKLHCI